MKKVIKYIAALLLLGAATGAGIVTSNSKQNVEAATSFTVNAQHQGMKADDKTDNTPILQKLLDKYNSDTPMTIHITKGTYLFKDSELNAIKLRSNVTFNFDKGAIFQIRGGDRIVFAYPSPEDGYNGGIKNVTWNNATFKGTHPSANTQSVFVQSLNHAVTVNFNKCTFTNAESPTGHYIDICGSHNIHIKNSTFNGFYPKKGYEYKEAIQVDYSNSKAMSYKNSGDSYDGLPSYNVYISNNKFLPINKASGTIKSYAPNPVGEHVVYTKLFNGTIHDVYFKGNTVQDAKPLREEDGANLHFVAVSNLYIENNTFENKHALGSGNYIRLYNTRSDIQMDNLNIKNNKFVNLNPGNRYVYFEKDGEAGDITGVDVSNNQITSSKKSISFVSANFSTDGMTIDSNKVSTAKATATAKAAKQKTATPINSKKNKKTNKVEKYYAGLASQYAYFKTNAKKTYALYTHIKGSKNWNYATKKLKASKATHVYIDMWAEATSGNWYRVRFTSSTSSIRYWIKAGSLSFNKITYEDYSKTVTPLQSYPTYTKVFNDSTLAKSVGTTASFPSSVNVTRRAVRTAHNGKQTTYYYIPAQKAWTRASAFF